jgi:hypothetical protein
MRKFFVLVMLVVVVTAFAGRQLSVSAAATAVAPEPVTVWVSGPSASVFPAAGWRCWGDRIGNYVGPVVVQFNTRPSAVVSMIFVGCALEPKVTLAARQAWASAKYGRLFKAVVWGAALPTPTKTATAIPATRTATRTATAKPPTATRTATRTATAVPTATPLPMLRADVVHTNGVFKPQLGWTIWCKTYGSNTNVVMKITTAPFYGVIASDCGAQTKAPFNSLAAISTFLQVETSALWTVK